MTAPDYGMTDHLAKTRAQLAACAKRGQWAQVAKIGGFKSEEAAKSAYSNPLASISLKPRVKTPTATSVLPPKTFSVSQGVDVQPAPREWVLKCKSRIAAIGLTLGDVSVSMGRCKSYISNRFMTTGYCSAEAKALIEAHLDYLETVVMGK